MRSMYAGVEIAPAVGMSDDIAPEQAVTRMADAIARERDAEFRPFRMSAAPLLLTFSLGALVGAAIGRMAR